MIIVAGIWFELQSPGIGFPTMAAIAAAILYFAPLYIEGLAQNWEIIAFVVGALLMLAELFIIPGFGVAGVLGILFMITGLVFALVGVDFSFSTDGLSQLEEPFLLVAISIVLAILILIWITSKIGQSNSFLQRIALTKAQDKEDGYVGIPTEITTLTGKTGKTLTILKPSGKVSIEGKTYDAVALVGFLEPDTPVVVVRHEAGQIYVKAVKAD
jgi:membrane-bound serine protease (ClpP class)